MNIDRRAFIVAAVSATLAPLAAGIVRKWEAAAAAAPAAAAAVRPVARGASTRVCASCGQPGHSLLDPACPTTAGIAAAVQTSARRKALVTSRIGNPGIRPVVPEGTVDSQMPAESQTATCLAAPSTGRPES
jgi:hypothetical protein